MHLILSFEDVILSGNNIPVARKGGWWPLQSYCDAFFRHLHTSGYALQHCCTY